MGGESYSYKPNMLGPGAGAAAVGAGAVAAGAGVGMDGPGTAVCVGVGAATWLGVLSCGLGGCVGGCVGGCAGDGDAVRGRGDGPEMYMGCSSISTGMPAGVSS